MIVSQLFVSILRSFPSFKMQFEVIYSSGKRIPQGLFLPSTRAICITHCQFPRILSIPVFSTLLQFKN